jgi:hypothetical protein
MYLLDSNIIIYYADKKYECLEPVRTGSQAPAWEPRQRSSGFARQEARASSTEFPSWSLGTSASWSLGTSAYLPYLPTEEELKRELERERRLVQQQLEHDNEQ